MGCCGKDEKYKGADYANPNYGGPETDDALKDGPIADRSCTDILCCLIFIAFNVAMVYVGMQGLAEGKPAHYIAMYDGSGNMCGQSAGYEDYKYLYFWTPMTGYIDRTTCVRECPTTTDDTELLSYYQNAVTGAAATNELDCKTNDLVEYCYGRSSDYLEVTLLSDYSSIYLVYPTVPMYNRFCVPVSLNETMASYYAKVEVLISSLDLVQNAISDIQLTYPLIAGSALLALFVSFLWMIVMKCCAACITWTFIIIVQLLLAAISYAMYNYAINTYLVEMNTKAANGEDPGENYYEFASYACAIITVAYFITICAFYTKIRIAIRIMETAADFVTECTLIVLVPPITSALIVVWVIVWLVVFVYVYCQGTFEQVEGMMYGTLTQTQEQQGMTWFFLFGGLWIMAFISACNQFIIASAACIWYFSPRDPENQSDKLVERAISRSIYRLFMFHLGSLAFGSFIVAVVQLVRIILAYVQKQVQQAGLDKQSKMVAMAFAAVQCCLACFERIIKFVNKNAYIQIAITSNCFCVACKDAFYLIFRNTFLFAIVAGIGEVFIWAGRIFITLVTIIACYFAMDNYEEYKDGVTYVYVPLFVIAMIAALIAVMFMSVWALAADSILVCFCIDKELNGKGGAVPNNYCPEQLLEFVQEDYNKILSEQAERAKKFEQEKFQAKRDEDPNYGKANGGCCC